MPKHHPGLDEQVANALTLPLHGVELLLVGRADRLNAAVDMDVTVPEAAAVVDAAVADFVVAEARVLVDVDDRVVDLDVGYAAASGLRLLTGG